MFNMHLAAAALLTRHDMKFDDGVPIVYRYDDNLYNLQRQKDPICLYL